MRKFLIFIFIILTIHSCKSAVNTHDKKQVPTALEDRNKPYEIVPKSYRNNLVEDIYAEILEKDSKLKEFENEVESLNQRKQDSLQSFEKYNSKNASYYSSASAASDGINDSLLRAKMNLLIQNSLTKYHSTISDHQSILEYIKINKLALADLHTVLKITRTLPVIEAFQSERLPGIQPLKRYNSEQTAAKKLADSLVIK